MDPPYLYHNNHRYSPFSPPHPPPRSHPHPHPHPHHPPTSRPFNEQPNFYGAQHHHLARPPQPPQQLAPPLLPPAPPDHPPHYRPFPGPQQPSQRPYHAHQFAYSPHPSDRHNDHLRSQPAPSSSHFRFLDPPHSPRIPHRAILHHRAPELDREIGLDLWERPQRVVLDNRSHPHQPQHQHHHHPVVKLDHHLQFDSRPMPRDRSIDRFRHGLECNSRFTEELNDHVGHNLRENFSRGRIEEIYHSRDQFVVDSDRPSSDMEFEVRIIESISGGHHDGRYGSVSENEVIKSNARDMVSENQRWVNDRHVLRDTRDSAIEMGDGEIGDGDVARTFLRKGVYQAADAERYNDKGGREGNNEFSRTPRKQIQKKSAFLRIQMTKPTHRSREDERSHYSGYFEEKKSSFRGKDPLAYSDRGLEEKEREESPMELDVSFKSNSLVAKAIAIPSSSSVASGTSLMPRKRKIRKTIVSSKDGRSSSSTMLIDGSLIVDNSTHVTNKTLGSENDLKQSKEKVTACSVDNKLVSSSKPSSGGTTAYIGKIKLERSPKDTVSYKGGSDAGPSKLPSQKVVKKKKIVKKVTKPPSSLQGSQSIEKLEEPEKGDSSGHGLPASSELEKCIAPSKEKVPSVGLPFLHGVDSQHSANESALPKNQKGDGSAKVIVLKEVHTDFDSKAYAHRTKKLGSSGHEEAEINEPVINVDNSVTEQCTMSNNEEDRNQSLNEITISCIRNVGDVSKVLCQGGSFLEDNALKESQGLLSSIDGNTSSGLLSSTKNNIHEDLVNASNIINGMNTPGSLERGLSDAQDSDLVSQSVGPVCKQVRTNQVSPIKSSNIEASSKAISSAGICVVFPSSSSLETGVNFGSVSEDCCKRHRVTLSGADCGFIHSKEINHRVDVDAGRQPYRDEVTTSPMIGASKGHPDNKVLRQGTEDDMPSTSTKREVLSYRLDWSSSVKTEIDVGSVNIESSIHGVDTNLSLSVRHSSPSAGTDTSIGCFDVGLPPCKDGVSVLHGSSLTAGLSETKVSVGNVLSGGSSGTSLEIEERSKVPCSYHQLPSPTASMFNDRLVAGGICKSDSRKVYSSNYRQQEGVMLSNDDTLCPSALLLCSEEVTVLLKNRSSAGSSEAVGSVRDASMDDGLKVNDYIVNSCSVSKDLGIPSALSLCTSGFGSDQIENATPGMDGNNLQNNITCMEIAEGEKMDIDAAEEQAMICGNTAKFRIPSEHRSPGSDKRMETTNVEYGSPSASKYLALVADGSKVSGSSNELMEFACGIPSDINSTKNLPVTTGFDTFDRKPSESQLSDRKVYGGEEILNEKSASEDGSNLAASVSSLRYARMDIASKCAGDDRSVAVKEGAFLMNDSENTIQNVNPLSGETHGRKKHNNHAVPKSNTGCSSLVFTARKTIAPSTRVRKSQTWHRTGNTSPFLPGNKPFSNTVPLQGRWPNKVTLQSTYIRKGNSLLRKPTRHAPPPRVSDGFNSSVYRLNCCDADEVKDIGFDKVDATDTANSMNTGTSAPLERPRTPPLPSTTKSPNHATDSSGDCTSSPLVEPLAGASSETATNPIKCRDTDMANSYEDGPGAFEASRSQTGLINHLECGNDLNDVNMASNLKSITYVKRKSNQLVATSSVHGTGKAQIVCSDGYYKRRKNQLIRTLADGNIKQTVSSPDNPLITEGKTSTKIFSGRNFSMRRSHKALGKPLKRSKLSLVWTLHGAQISNNDCNSLHYKVLPHLVPWKRSTYWRSVMQNSASISSNSSLSTISRKLLLFRKRDTIYTRSIHGLSLRKSKVLSVGGPSLKWSKSIERSSKKANEEATLAIAEVEKKKREQRGTGSGVSGTRNRNHASRERIFRIGSVRYKMDSSRRTLQRISDGESSCSPGLVSENDAKKSYVPRRLVIGNDEYVRIGNGNQLIRDPKKRTRVLASEKVRWSLHTARLRLAKKRKYCQFFTRFGKCNKDDGKCSYIHDPSKVAVCTKFLNDLCSNPSCKLTHKVIPERMPDCSYFLQGLCTNKTCPYRHVHVNPSASTCEGFLRGYCADGNECRKKHSYVCPVFEATGSCPQGSKCKLHHPKNRREGRKRKSCERKKNGRGRYFGSLHNSVSESGTVLLERQPAQDDDNATFEGNFGDYISLIEEEEAGESNEPINERITLSDNDPLDSQLEDLDELIKPVRIMNRDVMT